VVERHVDTGEAFPVKVRRCRLISRERLLRQREAALCVLALLMEALEERR
jgi:hypothetical protein